MLTARPKWLLSSDYVLEQDGRVLVEMDVAMLRQRARLVVEGAEYEGYREGLFSGPFVLERRGEVLARAVKPSAFRNRFEVEYLGARYELRREHVFSMTFTVGQGAGQVGRVERTGLFSRRGIVDLPAAWPLPVQAFVFWLVLIIWIRLEASG